MAGTKPKSKATKRSKAKRKKGGGSYTKILLLLMVIAGVASGFFAFNFGKKALQGVNPIPQGVKLPKLAPPNPQVTPTQKPSPTSRLDQNKMARTELA